MKVRTALASTLLAASLVYPSFALADPHCAGAPDGGAVRLEVQTAALRNDKGEVAVTLYPDDRRRFLAPKGKLLRQRVPATTPTTTACFWVQPGFYALAVYHDENENSDFDRTLLGMPAEGFGFSNNPSTKFGVPSFHSARFQTPKTGGAIVVRLSYRR